MEYGTLVVDASRRTARDDEPTPFFLCVCRGQLSVRYPLQTGLSADVQLVACGLSRAASASPPGCNYTHENPRRWFVGSCQRPPLGANKFEFV